MGSFDPAFLEVPEEVIIATIRANQKCFCLRDSSGKLAPNFIITSNQVAEDGGAASSNMKPITPCGSVGSTRRPTPIDRTARLPNKADRRFLD